MFRIFWRALLHVEDQPVDPRDEVVVADVDGDGNREAGRCGEECDLDTPGNRRRVHVARRGDRFEGQDHAGDGSEEAHEGRHVRDGREDDEAALQEAELDGPGGGDHLLELALVDLEVPDAPQTGEQDGGGGARRGRRHCGRLVDASGHRRLLDLLDHLRRAAVGDPEGPGLGDDDAEADEGTDDERVHHHSAVGKEREEIVVAHGPLRLILDECAGVCRARGNPANVRICCPRVKPALLYGTP